MPTVLRALALLSALAASEAYTVSSQSDLGRLLDYTPDYTALKVAGVQHSYNAPADTCEALSGTGEARARGRAAAAGRRRRAREAHSPRAAALSVGIPLGVTPTA